MLVVFQISLLVALPGATVASSLQIDASIRESRRFRQIVHSCKAVSHHLVLEIVCTRIRLRDQIRLTLLRLEQARAPLVGDTHLAATHAA